MYGAGLRNLGSRVLVPNQVKSFAGRRVPFSKGFRNSRLGAKSWLKSDKKAQKKVGKNAAVESQPTTFSRPTSVQPPPLHKASIASIFASFSPIYLVQHFASYWTHFIKKEKVAVSRQSVDNRKKKAGWSWHAVGRPFSLWLSLQPVIWKPLLLHNSKVLSSKNDDWLMESEKCDITA